MSVARFAALLLLAVGLLGPLDDAYAQTRIAQAAPAPKPGDAFGEEVHAAGEDDRLQQGLGELGFGVRDAGRGIQERLRRPAEQGIKPVRPPMTIYTANRRHRLRVSGRRAGRRGAERLRWARGWRSENRRKGRALKFIHRGSYDAMDSTYEAITNHLDEKRLEARDLFVEYYVTDPLTTPEDNLVIEV
jgi:hypothetical protein